ncbi:MAG: M55 family metallopeptidase [bacterium]|nr:M55 family metallopeptidase [bacterium]
MKLFISADMEGISGIVHNDQRNRDGRDYEKSRKLMTEEVNAAIDGALAAGVKEIVVNDSHDTMRNIIPADLHPAASLISGDYKPLSMMQGIDRTFDFVFFIGYHAKRGTAGAVMDHTYTESGVYRLRINGKPYGETGINAAVAGYFGVPVILVCGDDKLALEAKETLKNVVTVTVKFGQGRTSARNLHPEKVKQLIKSAAIDAIQRRKEFQPFKFTPPIVMDLDFVYTHYADRACRIPGVKRTGAASIRYISRDYLELFKVFLAVM